MELFSHVIFHVEYGSSYGSQKLCNSGMRIIWFTESWYSLYIRNTNKKVKSIDSEKMKVPTK